MIFFMIANNSHFVKHLPQAYSSKKIFKFQKLSNNTAKYLFYKLQDIFLGKLLP